VRFALVKRLHPVQAMLDWRVKPATVPGDWFLLFPRATAVG
jgi:hypothetical protein